MPEEIKWKGTTFTQLSSGLRFNNPAFANNHFGARPLKIYRREIANVSVPNCKSQRLEDFVIPGGTIRTPQTTGGIVSTTEYVNRDSVCVSANCSVIQSPAANARRRVRSSGMIKNKDTYASSNDAIANNINTINSIIDRRRSFIMEEKKKNKPIIVLTKGFK